MIYITFSTSGLDYTTSHRSISRKETCKEVGPRISRSEVIPCRAAILRAPLSKKTGRKRESAARRPSGIWKEKRGFSHQRAGKYLIIPSHAPILKLKTSPLGPGERRLGSYWAYQMREEGIKTCNTQREERIRRHTGKYSKFPSSSNGGPRLPDAR